MKAELLIIVSLFRNKNYENNYSHIQNSQGLLNNSDDNFRIGTP